MTTSILLIEDDDIIQMELAEALGDEGFEVKSAEHGVRGLQLLRNDDFRPSVILLDLMMPMMYGWEFVDELRRDTAIAHIPVILLSGVNDLDGQSQRLDVEAHLTKPIDFDRLLELIAELTSESNPPAAFT